MLSTHIDVIKQGAVINVPFTTGDIRALQMILLKNLDNQVQLDQTSWDTIEQLCSKVDECAKDQNLTQSREISF